MSGFGTTATAAVVRDPSAGFVIEPISLRDPAEGEALVRIVASGFCHSDLMFQRPEASIHLPSIFGHEGAGVIEAVGSGVANVEVGDHVVLSFDSCGACADCLRSKPAYCSRFRDLNTRCLPSDGTPGAIDASGRSVGNRWFGQSSFASHAIGTERNLVKVDRSLPLEILGPFGCGLQTGAGTVLNVLDVPAGSSIAIFGTGGVGMAAIMAARVAGAQRIVAVDLNAERLDLATELGATDCVSGVDLEPGNAASRMAGSVDFAIDTTGVPQVIMSALASLRVGGHLALVGTGTGPMEINPSDLAGRRVQFVVEGDAVPQTFIPQLIALWQNGSFPADRLVRQYSLDEVNLAAADLSSGRTIKPVLVP